jgi:hypothetical protein
MPLGQIRIFSKTRGDIRKSMCTNGVNGTDGKFATSVVDAGSKFAPGVSDTGGKFFQKFPSTSAISDTGGKFATGVNDTGGK